MRYVERLPCGEWLAFEMPWMPFKECAMDGLHQPAVVH
jgi:hypothetical protein